MWKQLKVSIYCVVRSTCCNVNLCRRKRREWKKNAEISRTTNIFRIFSFERWGWRSLPRSRARRLSISFYSFLFLGNFLCFSCDDESPSLFSFILILLLLFLCYTWLTRGRLFHMQTRRTQRSASCVRCKNGWVFREGSVFVRKTPYAPLPCMRIRGFVSLRSNAMAAFADFLPTLVALTWSNTWVCIRVI